MNVPLWVYQHLPAAIFVFCLGACVGSFLNVVIFRLPMGMSVISPPSRCGTCGAKLRFFRENLPILGYFIVRGRCRYCGVKLSPQYAIIELLMALMFLGLYLALFTAHPRTPWWGEVGGQWWYTNTIIFTWPAYIAFAFMLAGLVAMTVIDARTFMIPIQIPLFVTYTAFIAYLIQAFLPRHFTSMQTWPIHSVCWTGTCMAVGGMLGVLLSTLLLKAGRLQYSFADYHQYVKDDEPLADYPHARREMRHELLFMVPILLGLLGGWYMARSMPTTPPPVFAQAIGATFMGYLVGGGLVWGVRILGTLAFGREAMGMGDVHLLAAIGAVMGWFDPILIFFIAPFSGLLWHVVSKGIGSVFKGARRELPYGPHLAVATLIMILCRPGLHELWRTMMPHVPWPKQGLCG